MLGNDYKELLNEYALAMKNDENKLRIKLKYMRRLVNMRIHEWVAKAYYINWMNIGAAYRLTARAIDGIKSKPET